MKYLYKVFEHATALLTGAIIIGLLASLIFLGFLAQLFLAHLLKTNNVFPYLFLGAVAWTAISTYIYERR